MTSTPYVPCTVPTWAVFEGDGQPFTRPVLAWWAQYPCVLGVTALYRLTPMLDDGKGPRLLFLTHDDLRGDDLVTRVSEWLAHRDDDSDSDDEPEEATP